ncbi:MAG: protoporphyrinogen oxidase [Coriobacteriia bacterium]|nr:protoporphyrinogen oxidase [Coriobacteriia bacterium]
MKRIVVIGGGVAGLGAAYRIARARAAGHDVEVLVVERAQRLGGKLATDLVPDPDGGRYVVDGGSDAFVSTKPAVRRVATMLGIEDEIVPACDENKRTLIVKGRRLVELPDGIMMFAPTKLLPLATTPLYSWPGKLRMALDLVIPRKERWAPGESAKDHDETLEDFVVRRMGREALDRVAEPLVGGVHASDPSVMSLAATFPEFLEMEQKHGSLIRGFLEQRKAREAMKARQPARPGQKPWSFFNTFVHGMQTLPDAMGDAVGTKNITLGRAVTGLERRSGSWRVTLDDGEEIPADGVVLAVEAWAAVPLAASVDERIRELMEQIPCSSSATVPMAFAAKDCPFDLRWHGILVPLVEKRPLLAVTLSSSKWPDRAPSDRILLRGFIGGPRNQHLVDASDADLIETARREIVGMLGMPDGARPVFARVYRWIGGMPQYTLGHLDRVEEIETLTAAIPGFAMAGSAFRGVGIPNCIESGERAADKVLSDLGIAHTEDRSGAGVRRSG